MIVLNRDKEFWVSRISHCVDNTEKNSRKTKIMSVSDRVYNYECKTTESRCLCILRCPFVLIGLAFSEQERSPFLKIELPNGFSSQHKIRHLYLTKHAPLTFLHSLWWADKKKGVSFNTIKCKLRNFKCMVGECRWNVRKHRYISFGTLFLWTKNSTIAEFMVGKHFRELYPLVGNDACAGLFEVSRLFDVRKSDS